MYSTKDNTMKKLFFISILLLNLSCQEEKKSIKDITVTTKSNEAREMFFQALYADEQNMSGDVGDLLRGAIAKDSEFILAKVLLNSPFIRPTPGTNIKILSDIVSNSLDKVSEMEALLIRVFYHVSTREYEKAMSILDELTSKYPDISRLWQFSGMIKSYNGDIYEAIDDLNRTIEMNPDNYSANMFLMAKHIVVGNLGNMLPVQERDLNEAKKYIDKLIQINPNNSYGYTMAGNYERSNNNFEKGIEYYTQVGKIPSNNNNNVFSSNHYLALSYTFTEDYDKAETYFKRNIEIAQGGWKTQAMNFLGNLYVFSGELDKASEALDEYIEAIPTLEFSVVRENIVRAQLHFNKFLCYSHNQLESESLNEIKLHSDYLNKLIEYRKSSYTKEQFEAIQKSNNHRVLLLNTWHDILFGKYSDAREKLNLVKTYANENIKINPEAYYDYNALSGMVQLNEGNFDEAIQYFSKNKSLEIAGEMEMDGDYFEYFYALALKGSGQTNKSNEILKRLSTNNFYGYGRGLVRLLSIEQLKS